MTKSQIYLAAGLLLLSSTGGKANTCYETMKELKTWVLNQPKSYCLKRIVLINGWLSTPLYPEKGYVKAVISNYQSTWSGTGPITFSEIMPWGIIRINADDISTRAYFKSESIFYNLNFSGELRCSNNLNAILQSDNNILEFNFKPTFMNNCPN